MNTPEVMKRLYGDYAKDLDALLEGLDPEFNEIIKEFPYANIWSRPGLSLRERSMITISSLIAMGKEEQTEIHMKGFLNSGGSIEELRELIIHLSVYCGFPASLNSFKILNRLRNEKH